MQNFTLFVVIKIINVFNFGRSRRFAIFFFPTFWVRLREAKLKRNERIAVISKPLMSSQPNYRQRKQILLLVFFLSLSLKRRRRNMNCTM